MRIKSSKHLHYPIIITSLKKNPGDHISRSDSLFTYTYQHNITQVDKYGEESLVTKNYPADFQSEYEGKLIAWRIKIGDTIAREGVVFCQVDEPCRHDQQWGGLCVNCGKDMTHSDFTTSKRNDERVAVSMDARHADLKVSTDEALRVTDEEIRRLLSDRKLSLVVDLDQTVIHATVDPTVGEWQKEPDNPNYESLTDVRSFQLQDGGPASRSCWYYVKMRPGLQEFLDEVSKKYEMHVYTMGTGPYAQAIMKIIDPDRKVFGDRIITRDESGSTTVKSLLKVFPMDQKMVVIIDDRGDVWTWSPNLIKVVPYEFFRGIGDINASFLPKRTGVITKGSNAPAEPIEPTEPRTNGTGRTEDSNSAADNVASSETTAPPTTTQEETPNSTTKPSTGIEDQIHEQEDEITAQIESRPLLQSQKALDDKVDQEEAAGHETNGDAIDDNVSEASQKQKHKLLNDDDRELLWLRQSLDRVHKEFFKEYDTKTGIPHGNRISQLKGEKMAKRPKPEPFDAADVPDIQYVMPAIKAKVLGSVNICFTGVIPQNVNHAT